MKYRVVGAIVITVVLGLIWLAFSGEETQSPPSEQTEQEPGYTGLGR